MTNIIDRKILQGEGEKNDVFWDFYKYNGRRKLKLPYEQLEEFLNLNQQK